MLKFLFLAVLIPTGCAHHTPHYITTMTIVPPVEEESSGCIQDNQGVYWYVGKDGMIGEGASCRAATKDWATSMPVIVRSVI